MNTEKQIEYWIKSSEFDLQTASDIFYSGKNLHFCLYMCHLSLEKILKAHVVKCTKEYPPKSHNLLRLAEIGAINLTEELVRFLEELNQFQLSTIYPDEKFTLFSLATKDFTQPRFLKTQEIHKWLKSLIKN